ncbi:hypothetical protein HMPREF9104_03163 [Lentilactobacillus kisonensis F0435]|uniref:Uncharacterized protein n=1 Tax=Lentilactobacillus kisonensis F0435 TaxID=797516 RepID=H1LKK9_9LACO|nr:hypothetical protein HMPREF9104_03163 [Lentilactobacillus kisonensis F0435]
MQLSALRSGPSLYEIGRQRGCQELLISGLGIFAGAYAQLSALRRLFP